LRTFAHAQAVSSTDQIYSFDPTFVHSPVSIEAPEPEIPDQARQQKLDGLCAVDIVVDKKGHPENPRIVRCTSPVFAENSLKAAKRYRFVPATTVLDNKPVSFSMHIRISYRLGPDRDPIRLPRPKMKIRFLLPSQHAPASPDGNGVYTLSQDFEKSNSLPKMLRFADAGFSPAAYSLKEGAGCVAAVTINEAGQTTDAEITKCDDFSLEQSGAPLSSEVTILASGLERQTRSRARIHSSCLCRIRNVLRTLKDAKFSRTWDLCPAQYPLRQKEVLSL
jgi:TonB family protein